MPGLLESTPHRVLLLIVAQVQLRLGLVLVLICSITIANGLSHIVSIDTKNMMWCAFQVGPKYLVKHNEATNSLI